VLAPSADKSENKKDSFCEELEQVACSVSSLHHIKILLGCLNAGVGRDCILKLTVGTSVYMKVALNYNGITAVSVATFSKLIVKLATFLHSNIHKYT
jgi:hypothetical protein